MPNGLTEDQQYEADMNLAIQMSIEDQAVQNSGELVLPQAFQKEVYEAGGGGQRVWRGMLRQFGTLNQFHEAFAPIIEECESPCSICGAFVMAQSVLLPRLLAPWYRAHCEEHGRTAAAAAHLDITSAELKAVLLSPQGGLRDVRVLLPEVERALRWLRGARLRYMAAHEKEFPSPAAKQLYLSAWVANYEISDYLAFVAQGQVGGAALPVTLETHFLRNNQWPEYPIATHEERARIARDERRFGGRKDDATDTVVYSPGDVKYWVDTHVATASAHTRHATGVCNGEWRRHCREARRGSSAAPTTFVLDLNGHFVSAVAARLDGAPTLLVFNTTQASYLHMKALEAAYDCAFGTA